VADSPPRTLGRYEILDEIGRGTMGAVYRARDPALGRMVALKTISIVYAIPQDERESFQERFLMEARTAAVISHPGVVTVFDVGRDTETGTLFIAFEYLQGRTLGDMIGGGVAVEVKEALRLTARVAEALHHAHSCGIIHRDIKPANIMVLPSGEPKIMDFGIAKIRAAQLSLPRQVFGTPMFMSPEQALGGDVDARSDIFSLGSVLYLLLTSAPAAPRARGWSGKSHSPRTRRWSRSSSPRTGPRPALPPPPGRSPARSSCPRKGVEARPSDSLVWPWRSSPRSPTSPWVIGPPVPLPW
jgi:serine/threonine protein kinase